MVLAAGGSPTMAQDVREAAEAVRSAAALVCNLGAVGAVASMLSAGKKANALGRPVILNPVAAGNTELRRRECARLLAEVRFSVIRGNAWEIRALAMQERTGSELTSASEAAVTEESLPRAVADRPSAGVPDRRGGGGLRVRSTS